MQTGKTHLEADLRGVVYSLVAQNGGEKEYDLFERLHNTEQLQEEKERLSKAMTQFRDEKLLKKALEFSFSQHVRMQDTFIMVTYVWMNPKGKQLAWDFVQSRWKEIVEKFGAGGHLLPRFIEPASVFATKQKAQEVEKFFNTHDAPGAERTIAQVVEKIYANHEWISKDKKGIQQFLDKFTSRKGQ
jgi:puromycin-sensitive aminopeptidase